MNRIIVVVSLLLTVACTKARMAEPCAQEGDCQDGLMCVHIGFGATSGTCTRRCDSSDVCPKGWECAGEAHLMHEGKGYNQGAICTPASKRKPYSDEDLRKALQSDQKPSWSR
jgi:hypothetical protein